MDFLASASHIGVVRDSNAVLVAFHNRKVVQAQKPGENQSTYRTQ